MRRRGVTMIEMLVVVAILGVLSSISVVAVSQVLNQGRVNGTTSQVHRLLVNARLRALTMQCPHYVIINGPEYVAGASAPGAPERKGEVALLRKADCSSTALGFERGATIAEGDRVVSGFQLPPENTKMKYELPGGYATDDELKAGALLVEYNQTGQLRFGFVAAGTCEGPPTSNCNASTLAGVPELSMVVKSKDGKIQRTVAAPTSSGAVLRD